MPLNETKTMLIEVHLARGEGNQHLSFLEYFENFIDDLKQLRRSNLLYQFVGEYKMYVVDSFPKIYIIIVGYPPFKRRTWKAAILHLIRGTLAKNIWSRNITKPKSSLKDVLKSLFITKKVINFDDTRILSIQATYPTSLGNEGKGQENQQESKQESQQDDVIFFKNACLAAQESTKNTKITSPNIKSIMAFKVFEAVAIQRKKIHTKARILLYFMPPSRELVPRIQKLLRANEEFIKQLESYEPCNNIFINQREGSHTTILEASRDTQIYLERKRDKCQSLIDSP